VGPDSNGCPGLDRRRPDVDGNLPAPITAFAQLQGKGLGIAANYEKSILSRTRRDGAANNGEHSAQCESPATFSSTLDAKASLDLSDCRLGTCAVKNNHRI
jgi:hypothetical protein